MPHGGRPARLDGECHPVGAPLAGAREGSRGLAHQILRCAQDDIFGW